MPKLLGLVGERGSQMRMSVTERVDGDAGGEIEIAFAVRGNQPYAFAPLEGEVDTRKGRHQMRCHGFARKAYAFEAARSQPRVPTGAAQTKCAASPGGTEQHSMSARPAVNTR